MEVAREQWRQGGRLPWDTIHPESLTQDGLFCLNRAAKITGHPFEVLSLFICDARQGHVSVIKMHLFQEKGEVTSSILLLKTGRREWKKNLLLLCTKDPRQYNHRGVKTSLADSFSGPFP